MITRHDSVSAIESSAWLVFGWLAQARHSKTSHGDGGFVIAKRRLGGKSYSNSLSLDSDGRLPMKWFMAWFSMVWFPSVSHWGTKAEAFVRQ